MEFDYIFYRRHRRTGTCALCWALVDNSSLLPHARYHLDRNEHEVIKTPWGVFRRIKIMQGVSLFDDSGWVRR